MKKVLFRFFVLFFMVFAIFQMNIRTAKAEETAGDATGTAEVGGETSEETSGETVVEATDEATGDTVVETPVVISLTITQLPSKTTYAKGESLDLTDMVVEGYYADGTVGKITDYEIIGYNCDQVGNQTVIVYYQNQMVAFTISVNPAKVSNLTVSDHSMTSYTLTWDAGIGVYRYEVYCLDDFSGVYNLIAFADTNYITFYGATGTIHSYYIIAVENVLGIEYRGEQSDILVAATNPDIVSGLTVTGTTVSSISLSWTATDYTTGYLIYRSLATEDNYKLCGVIYNSSYTDEGLKSGQSYKYKVCAYTYSEQFAGLFSQIVDISTNPAKMIIKYKAGEQKIRITWSKVNGATSYDIYTGDEINGYTLLTSSVGNSGGTYLMQELVMGNTYNFYAIAHREYNGVIYDSPASELMTIMMKELEKTSTTAKIYPTKEDLVNSYTYNKLLFFPKYVNLSKSFIIPGLITTNVGGFSSASMCPQGITFAGDYFLMSAYDINEEENSVIYVMKKSSKKLLTTLILPSKPHAGGICYDGFNIWVTNGSKVSSILFSEVVDAAKSGEPYVYVNYNTVNPLGIVTSYITYYDGKLWVGSYNELQTTKMYSYIIDNKETFPVLTIKDTMIMPTRVQGVAFTKMGTLILSRSCQLHSGLRGYMRQLDSYYPDYANAVDGVIPLPDPVNSVSMPSMNEGIAVDGSYLYVNFESSAFTKSTYKMDRICAFKLTDVVKKKA